MITSTISRAVVPRAPTPRDVQLWLVCAFDRGTSTPHKIQLRSVGEAELPVGQSSSFG